VSEPEAIFFDGPQDFRAWLERNHATATEVWVGFFKKASGRQTMSWSEAVDQALCFGWIDGKLNRIDGETHRQRFTPRKPRSNWSRINVEKVERLEAAGLMTPAGRRAFEARSEARTGVYSFEREDTAELPPEFERRLRAREAAWSYFEGLPPGYRRTAVHWVMSAKRGETRERRLETLIDCSARGEDIPPLRRAG
jgi:uncharacterized protein YdeI (YjbR/CyaY-like superfamily)